MTTNYWERGGSNTCVLWSCASQMTGNTDHTHLHWDRLPVSCLLSILSAHCTMGMHCVAVRPQTEDLKSIHCHVMQSRDTQGQFSQSEGIILAIDQSEHDNGAPFGRNLLQDVTRSRRLFLGINQRLEKLISELTELMILTWAVTLFVCQLNILRYKSLAPN